MRTDTLKKINISAKPTITMTPLLILLTTLAAGAACCRQLPVVQANMQQGTVASLDCPLKAKRITWTELEGGQKAVRWGKRLILANVQGPQTIQYRCQSRALSALVNVTVSDWHLVGVTHGTVGHCQHGKPCAVTCPPDEYDLSRWPGVVLEKELWWGEEWKNVQVQGEDPMMISPGVMIADRLRNPSVAGCRTTYRVTEEGSEATGLPAGNVLQGPAKRVRMEIAKPQSHIVRPTSSGLSKTAVVPVVPGQRVEIACEGFAWDPFDEIYWLKSSCREQGKCDTEFVEHGDKNISRLYERENANTTLMENALGHPVTKTLVLDPVVESDLRGAFFCKLDSTGAGDVVTMYLKKKDSGDERSARRALRVGSGKRSEKTQVEQRAPR